NALSRRVVREVQFRHSEVGDFHVAVSSDQNVRGLQITMNDALTVCTIQGIRQIERDLKGLLRRQLIVIARQQHLVEGLPRTKSHDDVRSVRFGFLAYIEDGYNSRVRQASRRFCFPEKPL